MGNAARSFDELPQNVSKKISENFESFLPITKIKTNVKNTLKRRLCMGFLFSKSSKLGNKEFHQRQSQLSFVSRRQLL